MKDTYIECVAPRSTAIWRKPVYVALWTLMAFCLFYSPASWIFLAAAVLFLILALRFRRTLDVDYEYLLYGGDLHIDKVMNQSKRKRLAIYRVSKIELFGPVDAPQVQNYLRRCSRTVDYSSGPQVDTQYALCYHGHLVVLLTPSQQLVDAIRSEIPYKVAP